jgi:hypothetical protein
VIAVHNAGSGVATTDAGVTAEVQAETVLTLRELSGDGARGREPAQQEQRAWSDLVEPRLLQQLYPAGVQDIPQPGVQSAAAQTGKPKRKRKGKTLEAGHDNGLSDTQSQAEAAKAWVRARQSETAATVSAMAPANAASPSIALSSASASGTTSNASTPSNGSDRRQSSGGSASYKYDRITSISAQLEYYFSAKHLEKDEYLRGLLSQTDGDTRAWVTLEALSTYPKLNKMLQTGVLGNTPLDAMVGTMAKAVDQSELLELSDDRQALRPTQPPW